MRIATPTNSFNHDGHKQNKRHTLHSSNSNVTSLRMIDTSRYTLQCLAHFLIAGAINAKPENLIGICTLYKYKLICDDEIHRKDCFGRFNLCVVFGD